MSDPYEDAWPCVVIPDRYGGTYASSGPGETSKPATWLAFRGDNVAWMAKEIDASQGGDFECGEFWADFWEGKTNSVKVIGRGNTPDEAIADMIEEEKKWTRRSHE